MIFNFTSLYGNRIENYLKAFLPAPRFIVCANSEASFRISTIDPDMPHWNIQEGIFDCRDSNLLRRLEVSGGAFLFVSGTSSRVPDDSTAPGQRRSIG